ncbi:hypothetical protein OHB39_29190 [Streptomyces sp. NBC_00047]|uniref:hypothetical protein n=1 Tax=Streptomyces sp. NBC_00047 TaxID=2975627 RepID=UPI0022523BA1|nr:hypothetical protein [Streptomyces sp. NBC_00047]MCX5611599.1 hypothetical protein [Streptomyces sp. NBC_00047]
MLRDLTAESGVFHAGGVIAEPAGRTARLSAAPVRSSLEEALGYVTELRRNGTRPDPARPAAVEAALAAAATER